MKLARIRLKAGMHIDGTDYDAGEVVDVPEHTARGFVFDGRAVFITPVEPTGPLVTENIHHADPAAQHGDPTVKGKRGK